MYEVDIEDGAGGGGGSSDGERASNRVGMFIVDMELFD